MRKAYWILPVFGLLAGFVWFQYNLDIPVGGRFRGDAYQYFTIAGQFTSLKQALTYVDQRTVGFPALIYLWKSLFSVFGIRELSEQLDSFAYLLFAFHAFVSWALVRAARDWLKSVPAVAAASGSDDSIDLAMSVVLAILWVHPGMVSFTTVLLTDTFSTDLLMLAAAFLLGRASAARGSTKNQLIAAVGTGVSLAFSVLVRPSFGPTIIGTFVLVAAVGLWTAFRGKERSAPDLKFFGITAAAFLLSILPTFSICSSTYGQSCLQNPQFIQDSLANSVVLGSDSPRIYWSAYAGTPDAMVRLRDPYLEREWAGACDFKAPEWKSTFVRCALTRPHVAAVFFFKKSLALFDQFQLQSYSSDMTPRWARIYERFFGALAYAGWLLSLVGLVWAIRSGRFSAVAIFGFGLFYVLLQSVLHVEGRYGFPALPGAYLAIGGFAAWGLAQPRRTRSGLIVAVLVAMSVFWIQTASWDGIDQALQKVEGR